MSNKLTVVKNFLNHNKIDGLLLSSAQTRFWLTNFKSSAGFVFVFQKNNQIKVILIVDYRYGSVAKNAFHHNLIENVDEIIVNQLIFDVIPEIAAKYSINKIGFEGNQVTVLMAKQWSEAWTNFKLVCVNSKNLLIIKQQAELIAISKANEIVAQAFNWLLKNLKIGMKECEIANLYEKKMYQLGATKLSFPTIVAIDENSANPHASPSNKELQQNSILLLDAGCVYQGYCSDMTRTIFMGTPTSKQKKIYQIVAQAQQAGCDFVKENVKASDLDKTVRKIITDSNYGDYFIHATGHGVGQEVHEPPRISNYDHTLLKENMIITVEPGIYFANEFGIRIEDSVIVKKTNCKIMTSLAPKSLITNVLS